MMRLQTYAGFSFLAAVAVIYHAFNSREQFYPAMVHVSTSKICLVLLLNMGLVIMCILWQLVKRIFLGSLREAEVERLNEQSWREVMEILFAITIFRQDFSVGFLVMVTALLLIKALHWLAQKRVEYIETTPTVTMMSHIRIISFMGFLLTLDCLFFYSSVKSLLQTWQASVALFFSFEYWIQKIIKSMHSWKHFFYGFVKPKTGRGYPFMRANKQITFYRSSRYMILATTTISTFVKYIFYVSDMLMEGQWEKKAVYTFYLELVRDLLHLSMYIFFFFVIFVNYGVPLHLIRELYETFRSFKLRVADYVRYRKLTSNMNERFPDATPEELNASDATCIICREEMVTAKKLLCGHLFHVHCLRSWLERQHTCPTCRSLVVPPENGPAASRQQRGVPSESSQPGSVAPSSSIPESTDGAAGGSSTNHQTRLQAAAVAASLYGKSFVLPPRSTFFRSPEQSFVNNPAEATSGGSFGDSTGEAAGSCNGETSSNSADLLALVKAQASLIQQQTELLQIRLREIHQLSGHLTALAGEGKGKSVIATADEQ